MHVGKMKGRPDRPCVRRTTIKGGRVLVGGYGRYRVLRSHIIRAHTGVIGGIGLIKKTMQIYNMDETGLSIVHKPGRVITQVGRCNVWAITSAEKGKTHTVLTCASASGCALPPFMIYLQKQIADNLKVGAVPSTVLQ